MSGIQNNLKVNVNDVTYSVKAGLKSNMVGESGVTIPINLTTANLTAFNFNFDLQLQRHRKY
ncbi:MAG: inner membrane CreD family protein [Bacteroidetes bacterium]|nr:inner membrane CreD family protein [Bacteroidota bacterium]